MIALIGGDVLIGGLSTDTLHLANGQEFQVHETNGLASFVITFSHNAILQAAGKPFNKTTYKGNFSITQDGETLTSGVWSATPVQDPRTMIGYEFVDDAADVDYSGALVLGTAHGTLYLPDGTAITARLQRIGPANSLSAPIELILNLSESNTLTCIGTPLKNTAMQGISGFFQDPLTHRPRVCNALVISL